MDCYFEDLLVLGDDVQAVVGHVDVCETRVVLDLESECHADEFTSWRGGVIAFEFSLKVDPELSQGLRFASCKYIVDVCYYEDGILDPDRFVSR